MLRIGLTGGIAAGKSAAAARFAALGALVVDHDLLARQAVAPGAAALADIAREFGDRLIVEGKLDRKALANVVFHDRGALRRLNGIVHPYVFSLARAADRRAREDHVNVVVHDIPLLADVGASEDYDLVVTVAAALPVRLRRLMDERGLTHEEAYMRIDSQVDDEARAAIADVVIDGNGTLEYLYAQVDEVWRLHVP